MRTHPTGIHDTLGGDRNELLKLIAQLAAAMITGTGRQSCIAACDKLLTFMIDYFAMEKTLITRQGTPPCSQDDYEDKRFIGYVNDLRDRFKTDSAMVTSEALNTLLEGLKSHIQRTDKSLGGATPDLSTALDDDPPALPRGSACPVQGDRRLWQMRQSYRRRASDLS